MKITITAKKVCWLVIYAFFASAGQFFFPFSLFMEHNISNEVLLPFAIGLGIMLALHIYMAALYIFNANVLQSEEK